MTAQQIAFLAMLRFSEIGPAMIALSDRGYNVLVGSTPKVMRMFVSYADHPHVYDAALDSTAAGGYQIIYPTWARLKKKLVLLDFSPESQDTAGVELLHERGALNLVEGGNISQAILKCAPEWASLPGSTAGQHQQKFSDLKNEFTRNAGVWNS